MDNGLYQKKLSRNLKNLPKHLRLPFQGLMECVHLDVQLLVALLKHDSLNSAETLNSLLKDLILLFEDLASYEADKDNIDSDNFSSIISSFVHQFSEVLSCYDIYRIYDSGKINPERHCVKGIVPLDGHAEGTICRTLRAGWVIKKNNHTYLIRKQEIIAYKEQ